MNEKDFNYLTDNMVLLGPVRWTVEQQKILFGMYNRITGENKPMTSCGRCVLNIKNRLKFEYAKYKINN
jgi:hypothetical protein